jgi:N-acetylglutamate synthase
MPQPTVQNPISFLEELSLNAWPSTQNVIDDGWVLRFADGYSRRANSVNSLSMPSGDLEEKIRRCEAWYRARNQEVIFKLTPMTFPKDLDKVLAKRGYKEDAPTSVQTMSLDGLEAPKPAAITLSPHLSREWLQTFCKMRGVDLRYLDIMQRIMDNILPAKRGAILSVDGEPAAMGMAVMERGYVGFYDIITAEEFRNRGLGEQMMLHLLYWAKSSGATNAYLQVMSDNPPAVRLYEKLGFTEVYQYWYRVKP